MHPIRLIARIVFALLFILVWNGAQATPAPCDPQGGASSIGIEASSTGGRFPDGSFYYQYALINCINGQVDEWNSTSFQATPYQLWQTGNVTGGFKLFSNSCGSHVVIISKGYTGTVNGYKAQTAQILQGQMYLPAPNFTCAVPGPAPNNGCPCTPNNPTAGDPIHLGTGNSYQSQVDWAATGPSPLQITRYYNTQGGTGSFAVNWRTEYDRSVVVPPPPNLTLGGDMMCLLGTTPTSFSGLYSGNNDIPINFVDCPEPPPLQVPPIGVLAYRQNGKIVNFPVSGGKDLNNANLLLTLYSDHVTITDDNDNLETYNKAGLLQAITYRNGLSITIVYDANNHISTVTDSLGKILTYNYNAKGELNSVSDPAGNIYSYGYDVSNNLIQVSYPDNSSQQYLYESSGFPNNMTAIIDENGARYRSWTFDGQGRAVSNQQGNGVANYTVTYGANANQTGYTNPLGLQSNVTMTTINGLMLTSSITQVCSDCPTTSYQYTYDANGNISSLTDYLGHKTTYVYDLTRNLETSRTEAVGTSQQRTITTQWHPSFRLPVTISDPVRTTTFQYDAHGNLLNKTMTANGQSRVWQYTYNSFGEVMQVTDPLLHNTQYQYDSAGNLVQIVDALGHITTLGQYDLDGRVGRVTDPNLTTTALSYDPRGRVIKRVRGGEITGYTYDRAGQLLQVTRPDGSWLSCQYDSAHRLTHVQDSLGNQISYTLDGMGNRTAETTADPNGTLATALLDVEKSLQLIQHPLLAQN